MKIVPLIAILFVGLASADLVNDIDKNVESTIQMLQKGMARAGKLQQIMTMPNSQELKNVDKKVRKVLITAFKETLQKVVKRIKSETDHARAMVKTIHEKVEKLKLKITELQEQGKSKEEIVNLVKQKAKNYSRQMLYDAKTGGPSLLKLMDYVGRFQLKTLVNMIKKQIITDNNIERLEKYIENIDTKNEVLHVIKEMTKMISNEDIKVVLDKILNFVGHSPKDLNEAWHKLRNHLNQLNPKVKESFLVLTDWMKSTWTDGLKAVQDNFIWIKSKLSEYVVEAKEDSVKLGREILAFFQPYNKEIGSVWEQLKILLKELIGHE
ncbi:uncharacterized protein LOC143258557 [Tachypleus tridentatus]|uniref:uncharacterized protein LOC143258557 n=1 Tax=Tachypleus tridentatus TaxID=6853 RepID=UPI003FD59DC5